MPLKLTIEYDPIADIFQAELENGAKFTFKRQDVGGKLENNLTLYRHAVIAFLEDKPLRPTSDKKRERNDLMRLSAGKNVQVVGLRKNKVKIDLDSISLDDLDF